MYAQWITRNTDMVKLILFTPKKNPFSTNAVEEENVEHFNYNFTF